MWSFLDDVVKDTLDYGELVSMSILDLETELEKTIQWFIHPEMVDMDCLDIVEYRKLIQSIIDKKKDNPLFGIEDDLDEVLNSIDPENLGLEDLSDWNKGDLVNGNDVFIQSNLEKTFETERPCSSSVCSSISFGGESRQQNISISILSKERFDLEPESYYSKPRLLGGVLMSCVEDNYRNLENNKVSVDYQYKISPKKALYDLCCLLGLDLPRYVVTENHEGIVGFGCTLALVYQGSKFEVHEPNRYKKKKLIVENLCSQRMLFSLHEVDPGRIPKPLICNDYRAILWDYCVSEGIRVPEYEVTTIGIVHRTYECRILFKDKVFISRGHALSHVSQECARRILDYYELSCDVDWKYILETLCKRMKIEGLEFKENYDQINTIQILCICRGKKYMSGSKSAYYQAMKDVVQQVILDLFF